MMVAHELHLPLSEFYQKVDLDELGWWLAYIKRKNELDEKARNAAKNRKK